MIGSSDTATASCTFFSPFMGESGEDVEESFAVEERHQAPSFFRAVTCRAHVTFVVLSSSQQHFLAVPDHQTAWKNRKKHRVFSIEQNEPFPHDHRLGVSDVGPPTVAKRARVLFSGASTGGWFIMHHVRPAFLGYP